MQRNTRLIRTELEIVREDIICLHVDTNLIFECSNRYLTPSRYRHEHEKIKIRIHVRACNILSDYLQYSTDQASISHVIFCLLLDIDEVPGERFLGLIVE